METLLLTLFSWIVLSSIAIIVSGKLMAKRIPLGLTDEDQFVVNLKFLKLGVSGDGVSWGLTTFLFSLIFMAIIIGPNAEYILSTRVGLEIGQWNSICALASIGSIVFAFLFYLICTLIKGAPIISVEDRSAMIAKIEKGQGNAN